MGMRLVVVRPWDWLELGASRTTHAGAAKVATTR